MSQMKGVFHIIIILIIFLSVFEGCSRKNEQGLMNPLTGRHAENWIVDHRPSYIANRTRCVECHGADRTGGISGVSCFSLSVEGISCHPNGPFEHPDGWAAAGSHGKDAKSAPDTTQGFAYCKECHGSDFAGGLIQVSCFTCHGVNAPHPKKPWYDSEDTTLSHYKRLDKGNLDVCNGCHANGNNSDHKPDTAAAPGTALSCWNSTLCHRFSD